MGSVSKQRESLAVVLNRVTAQTTCFFSLGTAWLWGLGHLNRSAQWNNVGSYMKHVQTGALRDIEWDRSSLPALRDKEGPGSGLRVGWGSQNRNAGGELQLTSFTSNIRVKTWHNLDTHRVFMHLKMCWTIKMILRKTHKDIFIEHDETKWNKRSNLNLKALFCEIIIFETGLEKQLKA